MLFQWLIILFFFALGMFSLFTFLNGLFWKIEINKYITPSLVPWLWLLPFVFAIGLSFFLYFMWCMGGPTEVGGRKKANAIIAALELYKEDIGFFPEQLKDLSPDYVNRIPFQFQNDCTYYSNGVDGKSFTFEYVIRGTSDNWNCYYPELNEWMVWDSGCMPLVLIQENSP